MRFLPLVSSRLDPEPWRGFPDLELHWDGARPEAWARAVRGGLAVHAVHLPAADWDDRLAATAVEVVGAGLGPDFLVMPAQAPASRRERAGFLGTLEAVLEACTGRGVKVALRPAPAAAPRLVELLREVHGDGVGFCWDGDGGEDPEPIADRLHCAVGGPEVDPRPLQRLGYRWNLAVPATDPGFAQTALARLARDFPAVLFPAEMPATALGRPVVPDPEVSLGPIWNRSGP